MEHLSNLGLGKLVVSVVLNLLFAALNVDVGWLLFHVRLAGSDALETAKLNVLLKLLQVVLLYDLLKLIARERELFGVLFILFLKVG